VCSDLLELNGLKCVYIVRIIRPYLKIFVENINVTFVMFTNFQLHFGHTILPYLKTNVHNKQKNMWLTRTYIHAHVYMYTYRWKYLIE